ncbi:glycoside hydrolase family 130 protein [Thermococcus sp. EP1]|uniref:glycoside hydrolase family 130 protein n=1 Tax=Thermococcus sp. EP1 TaxID=1591054 RepID=UPI0009EC4AEE|nr:glycoside hydrolase family 130 protein [Thermococcus sp. EP1]
MKKKYAAIIFLLIFTILFLTYGFRYDCTPPISGYTRVSDKPILSPGEYPFESKAAFNPAAIVVNDTIYLFYRAQDNKFRSYIALATSKDGINFKKYPQPVIYPTLPEERMGCEDPRIVKINDTYYMTYTAFDGSTARLAIASSKDLIHWEKHGIVFPEWPWTKSGAILPVKINGSYIMFFGDWKIWIAYSKDLIHWKADWKNPILEARLKMFDERLVEPGPPPILTDRGILLFYNGASWEKGYSVGWVLLDPSNPYRVIARSDEPIFEPQLLWEKVGNVPNVVFAEGLVRYKGKWIMYYGATDKYTGAIIAPACRFSFYGKEIKNAWFNEWLNKVFWRLYGENYP